MEPADSSRGKASSSESGKISPTGVTEHHKIARGAPNAAEGAASAAKADTLFRVALPEGPIRYKVKLDDRATTISQRKDYFLQEAKEQVNILKNMDYNAPCESASKIREANAVLVKVRVLQKNNLEEKKVKKSASNWFVNLSRKAGNALNINSRSTQLSKVSNQMEKQIGERSKECVKELVTQQAIYKDMEGSSRYMEAKESTAVLFGILEQSQYATILSSSEMQRFASMSEEMFGLEGLIKE